jgi:hypothetical protein
MRVATGIVLWLVAAAAATAVALVAVSTISTDIFGGEQDPLTQSEVDALLSSSPTTPPSTTSTPVREGVPTVTEGGTILARCSANGLVEILSTTPAQGYSVDDDDDLEDNHPSVKFQSTDTEIEVKLRCVNGTPQSEIKYDD